MVKKIVALIVALAAPLIMAAPVVAYNPLGGACNGVSGSAACSENSTQQNNPDNPNPVSGTTGVLQTASNIIAVLAGIVAVIMIVISGIRYASAAGNAEKAKRARGTLLAAVIGLVVVALAWTLVTFVVEKIVK